MSERREQSEHIATDPPRCGNPNEIAFEKLVDAKPITNQPAPAGFAPGFGFDRITLAFHAEGSLGW